MTRKDLNWVFDRCLERLQGGASLESVLAEYPEWTGELKPVLESILAIWASRGSDTIPIAAMVRSRERLSEEIQRRRAVEPPPPAWKRWLRQLRPLMVPAMVLLVVIALSVTGLASVEALPGEALYPVKLAAERISLSLPASPMERLEREETFDSRRQAEVRALIDQHRTQEVFFSGYLTYGDDKVWRVNQIPLDVPANLVERLQSLIGQYIFVRADLQTDGLLQLQWFESRIYNISGRVSAIDGIRFKVDDLWVELGADAAVRGMPGLGQYVTVSVIRLSDGRLVAIKVDYSDVQSGENNPTATIEERQDESDATDVVELTSEVTLTVEVETPEAEETEDPTQPAEITTTPEKPDTRRHPSETPGRSENGSADEVYPTPAPTDPPG